MIPSISGNTILRFCFLLFFSLGFGLFASAHADKHTQNSHAKTVSCALTESNNGVTTYAVFYLAGFNSDGTSYYRTISAPIFELTVLADKTVESAANPCKSPLEFEK